MCATSRFGRAPPRLRMSLSGLWFHHGLRGGCAVPEAEAVVGATPIFRCPVWHRGELGCALHPTLPRGSLRVHQSFAGRPAAARGGVHPDFGGGCLGHGAAVGLAPMPEGSARGRVGDQVARRLEVAALSVDRRRNPDGGRCAVADADHGVGAKVAVGGRGQRLRIRTRAEEPARAVWGTAGSRSGIGLIRRVPQRRSGGLPAGIDGAGATPGGQGRGVNFHLAPNPYRALGEGGRSPPRPEWLLCHGRPCGEATSRCRARG